MPLLGYVIYHGLVKEDPWAVHLTLILAQTGEGGPAGNTNTREVLKAVRDIVGLAPCTSVNHCAAV